MKKTIQIIKICIFVGILLLPSLLWYGIKAVSPDTYQKLDYDLGENRTRVTFPQEFHMEDYTQQLEAYYNDNAPFRSRLIFWQQKLFGTLEGIYTDHMQGLLARLVYGVSDDTVVDMYELFSDNDVSQSTPSQDTAGGPISEHEYEGSQERPASCPEDEHEGTAISTQEADYTSYGYTVYQCNVCRKVYYDDIVAKRIDNSFFAPQIVGGMVLPGRFDWLFYAGDDSISYYRGINILEEEQMAANLDLMVQLQELCDHRGIQLQFLFLPNKEQVYPEYMPSYTIEDTQKRMGRFVDYVREHSDINIIYPLQKLRQADVFWQTYHKYDTHWNHAGAFVGTQALYEALGMPTTDLHDLEVDPCDATTCDLILLGGLDASQYPTEYDYEIDYRPDVTLTDIQGGIQPYDTYYARSDCGNDKNLVFIGDSFRCFMIDYLAKDFSHSVITYRETSDNRTDYPEEVIESIRSADILVLEAVERFDEKLFPAIQKMIEILQEDNYTDDRS